MGGKQCKPVVGLAEARSQLRKDQYEEVKATFYKLARTREIRGALIQKEVMVKWLHDEFLPGANATLLERFFQMLDIDSNGSISFPEFVIAAYILLYSPDHVKLKQMFNLYDLEGTGKLTRKGFIKINNAILKAEDAKTSQGESMKGIMGKVSNLHAVMAFQHASIESNGISLTFSEFRRFAASSQAVQGLLASLGKKHEKILFSSARGSQIAKRFGPFSYSPDTNDSSERIIDKSSTDDKKNDSSVAKADSLPNR